MHTMATIGPCSDAEDLLASIHLERYLDHFRQAGFLLARDFCHVDNVALNRVGVTATGHRKRILKLVEHIQLICQQPSLDRCNSDSAIHEVTPVKAQPHSPSRRPGISLEALRNSSAPNLCAQVKRSFSERSTSVVKPVPKPRTVFHRLRAEKISLPTQHEAQPRLKSSQDSLLKVAEGLSSSTDTVETSTESKKGHCEPALSNTISFLETSDPLPPVPPRLNRGIPPSTFRRLSEQERLSTPPLCTPPDSPSSYQCSPFTNTPGSPPSPPCSGLEMVSNEIYCGTLPGTPLSAEDEDEMINPYCETVFHSRRHYQHSEVERTKSEEKTTNNEDKKREHGQHNHSWLKRLDSPGYCTVGEPSPASPSFSDEDHIISPYASFTSLSERAAPILSGWLDKLSPQGNYVFQKRYVKFDGRNLMYYASEKIKVAQRHRQHRGLGTMVSKVQSLKLDTEKILLFIMLGNDRANEFWAARLPVTEELDCDASPEQRKEFITHKYREGRYRHPHPSFSTQEELLKALCTAVTEQNLLKTVTQIFAEAEAARLADANGNDKRASPHYLYTQSADSCVYDEIMQSILYSGYLYKSSSLNKGTLSRRTRDADFQKYWCSVEKSILFYESDRCHEPSMKIDVKDIICLGVSRPDSSNNSGFIDKFRYTFELYLTSDKLIQFGLETPDALHSWARAIGKATTPLSCHCLLAREFERVGVLRYKAMLDPQQWKEGFFVLQKSNLFICPGNDGAAEDIINLKRLQELSIASETENHEKKDILVLVEKGRTLHLQGMGRTDFSLWYADIQKAAGGKGNTLKDQQLSRNDIPIIVDSCIAFITQYGLGHEGIYRKNGAKSRIKLLMEEFRKDARIVKLRIGDNFIEDVTDVLKRFFREIDDHIFMADLHPFWREAAKIPQKPQRLDRYKELIRGLPRVNRTTLAALISHLYRVQKCADLNQMCTKNLSLLFAPSLFQTDGKGEHEVKIIEDLIDNYLYIFDIDEEHQTQIELEISLITTWRDTQLSQAGDLIIEVYLEEKLPDCCITLKVSPTMCAEELTNQVLYMRNIPAGEKDVWMTFEAIEEGELERPLHPKEKVLEQALQWCKMADPSSAYLVVKKVPRGEAIDIFTAYKSEIVKSGVLKCREEPPKLLQGNKFQERSFQIKDHRLLLMKDKKSNKPEKEWQLKTLKIYMGIRKKLKPPTKWGLTVMLDKQQLYLSCSCETELWDWMTNLLKAQNDDLRPPVMRRHSSSDISKQKFGTMPLVPIRGEESNTNSTMLSANQTLRKLHTRRALSMFFPMKVQQDSFEERIESSEPLYEEVGDFGLQVLKSLETSFLSSAHTETQEVPARPVSLGQRKAVSLDRMVGSNPVHSLLSSGESIDTLGQEDPTDSLHVPHRHRSHRSCSPQQELLLQELSTMFCKNPESEEQHENLT
ncbi:arf-GAP with Rho-GAP domain, ANK repeat and PH domain-containing protein 3-like [Sinocyclocheilus rhinocerous]|uniref:arf-GAP with Rho-GAP domain, ANK repeat and PH domain-containing protein 3-like n=1 Tax=Sinocyclocheilus rhinocerous TaxID=307959 RepID=UPI0007BA9B7B|nr:PREDICTED: arf-GAP with Rho-GAP domain, ANK repeat and PH domain-containing protein 3-like [Sinocyclocheilus rhinocerous]